MPQAQTEQHIYTFAEIGCGYAPVWHVTAAPDPEYPACSGRVCPTWPCCEGKDISYMLQSCSSVNWSFLRWYAAPYISIDTRKQIPHKKAFCGLSGHRVPCCTLPKQFPQIHDQGSTNYIICRVTVGINASICPYLERSLAFAGKLYHCARSVRAAFAGFSGRLSYFVLGSHNVGI